MRSAALKTGTLLAFDPGRRRIGVAVGETVTGSARPLVTLQARDGRPDWEEVRRLIEEWRPEALVIGLPRHADGTASTTTDMAERLARRLEGRFGLPVHTVDERLSTAEARDRLGPARVRKDPPALDREAAAIILETFFAIPEEADG